MPAAAYSLSSRLPKDKMFSCDGTFAIQLQRIQDLPGLRLLENSREFTSSLGHRVSSQLPARQANGKDDFHAFHAGLDHAAVGRGNLAGDVQPQAKTSIRILLIFLMLAAL
jgi:hypothetical protein